MSDHDPLFGKQLGDYKITGVLGQGGMARVYRGYDEKLERLAAVKVFDSRGVTSEELKEYSERFQREARAIARLRHPHIVNVYQSGQADNVYYMAMMFIDGQDLRQIMKEHANNGTRMSFQDVLRIMTDVASALDYAHKEEVIHRDIKPSNIMVMADGHAILTDFGLALSVPEGTLGTTFGSVHYIAPEQAVSSAQAVPQSDLYSLGVVLYEMLSGRVPFDDASAMSVALKHLSEPPPPPRLYNPLITPQIETMVLRALDKETQKRYQTGAAFIQALENAFGMTDLDEATRKLIFAPDWMRSTSEINAPKTAIDPRPSTGTMGTASGRPQPIIATADDRTISEKSAPGKLVPPQPNTNNTRNIALVAIALLVIALGVLLLSRLNGGTGGTATPTVDSTSSVIVAADATALTETLAATANEVVSAATDELTEAVTEEATDTPTRRPSPTRAPTSTATDEPTARPTLITPTAEITSEPVVSITDAAPTNDPDAQLQLIYDEQTVIVLNRGAAPIDLTNMSFVQTTATGGRLQLQTSVWGDGTTPLYALPPGDCFQVWRNDQTTLPVPDTCDTRHAWIAVSTTRWFWISEIEQATFDVQRGGIVIAECPIAAGECFVKIDDE